MSVNSDVLEDELELKPLETNGQHDGEVTKSRNLFRFARTTVKHASNFKWPFSFLFFKPETDTFGLGQQLVYFGKSHDGG